MAKQSSSEIAYSKLKAQILQNELAAGYQATEEEIARQLGMSRTPTREALMRLQNEGLVEVRPRHGMRVLPVSVDDMREIYDILTSLESMAAGQIAQKGLADAELKELSSAVADMDAALKADDLVAWAEADKDFHSLLVSLHGNVRMQTLVNNFMDQSHRCRMLTLKLRPRPDRSNADHAAVLEAIRRRDPDAARRIHRQHREKSAAMLIDLLEDLGLKQL
ncbi:MAG: GntR family transcriptional regulator [Alphaproteobacteria bacterium]|jgi:DNA-binding GntR family transcriptional regulator|nr:GntR family transcriptional regulator [Alphaproteobacteria bacterium]MBT4965541.1 GntR family transcriptional regulator [Alphaproteobacteria bacterium]MBT5160376.1 GntR family transcriptional regulator [Alphaproteobacteria bacterium]MBT5917307.1 GntR family transcriptional regulator [Alphaproteobacteria bacterium]MBT6387286.1 GntR family transcriptional regulator [Alphaproteobacteria bacterium]